MQYSLEKISTVQACNDLLTRAQQKRRALDRKRRNLGESIRVFRKRMDHIEKELVNVRSSLTALTTAYHAMPEGKEKAAIHVMVKRLELRQARLEKQAYTCNVAALLVKEMKYNALDSQVSAMDDYAAAVERLKTALGEPALRVVQPNEDLLHPVAQERLQISVASVSPSFTTARAS